MSETRQQRRANARESAKGPTVAAVAGQFPKIRITGGPSPSNIEVLVDGKPARKVRNIELRAGVNEAASLVISQFIEIDVEMDALVAEAYVAVIREPQSDVTGVIKSWVEIATGKGKTLKAAVLAAAQAIPEAIS